jgi:hypothetical protein
MSRICIKMRPVTSTAFPQSTTIAKEAGGNQEFGPPVGHQSKAVLTKV